MYLLWCFLGYRYFSKSADVLWQSNDGYIPICNSCRDAYYYKLVDLFNGNESKAIEYFCMQFGWVYDIEGLKAAKQISGYIFDVLAIMVRRKIWDKLQISAKHISIL